MQLTQDTMRSAPFDDDRRVENKAHEHGPLILIWKAEDEAAYCLSTLFRQQHQWAERSSSVVDHHKASDARKKPNIRKVAESYLQEVPTYMYFEGWRCLVSAKLRIAAREILLNCFETLHRAQAGILL